MTTAIRMTCLLAVCAMVAVMIVQAHGAETPAAKDRKEAATDKRQPRGYSIPLIDLDAQTKRQVVVDREKGQYLGHPTTVLLEDNKTMICVYPKGHGRGAIVM